jgi:predicted DNA-binding transcriptional regulator AlpA
MEHSELPDRLLDSREAGRLLGFSRATLVFWRVQRKRAKRGITTRYQHGGPPFVKIGRATRYWLTDLVKWVQEQARASQENEKPVPRGPVRQ